MRAVSGVTRVTRPTRPSAVTTGSLTRTPLSEPAAMTIACVKRPPGDAITSAATDRKSAREARAVDVVQQLAEVLVLLERERALDRALSELPYLGAERLGLASARSEEAVGPGVGVAERLRDALEPDRERPEGGRARRLDAAQRAVVARAEGERNEDQERSTRQPTARRRRSEPALRELGVGGVRRTVRPSAADRALRPGHDGQCS